MTDQPIPAVPANPTIPMISMPITDCNLLVHAAKFGLPHLQGEYFTNVVGIIIKIDKAINPPAPPAAAAVKDT